MASTNQSAIGAEVSPPVSHGHDVSGDKTASFQMYDEGNASDAPRPAGWKYRQRKIGSWVLPWYASPKIQLGMVAFVCFMCPGMFNALSDLGGGGKTNATLADNMVRYL